MNHETVSIIIPTYYQDSLLDRAISSAVNQTYDETEVIVVDDSGEGYAREIVDKYGTVQYIELPENRGANNARNIGYEASSGDYIQFLDDDDYLYDSKIDKQIKIFNDNEEIGVVYCGVTTDNGKSLPDPSIDGDVLPQALSFQLWPCMTTTMLIDDSKFSDIYPMRNRPGADDLALMINLARITKFGYVPEVLVYKGGPDNSRGKSNGAIQGRKQILEEYSKLYNKYPGKIMEKAISETYRTKGLIKINNGIWSPSAILAFYKSYRYSNNKVKPICRLAASLFGKYGWKLANYIFNR